MFSRGQLNFRDAGLLLVGVLRVRAQAHTTLDKSMVAYYSQGLRELILVGRRMIMVQVVIGSRWIFDICVMRCDAMMGIYTPI